MPFDSLIWIPVITAGVSRATWVAVVWVALVGVATLAAIFFRDDQRRSDAREVMRLLLQAHRRPPRD